MAKAGLLKTRKRKKRMARARAKPEGVRGDFQSPRCDGEGDDGEGEDAELRGEGGAEVVVDPGGVAEGVGAEGLFQIGGSRRSG